MAVASIHENGGIGLSLQYHAPPLAYGSSQRDRPTLTYAQNLYSGADAGIHGVASGFVQPGSAKTACRQP